MFILYLNRILHRLLLPSSFLLLILILHIHHGAVIMPVLLTGGTGKTSVRLARFLQNENIPFLLASRRGLSAAPSGMPAVQFDWLDQSTWKEPFQHRFAGGGTISAIYLMEPLVAEPWKPMNEFIDYARKEHGVSRFVLVAGSSAEPSQPGMGMVWQHFLDTGVDYCVLRPSWFMGVYTS